MTTYLIDYSATWVGFETLAAADRLIVTPQGALILPSTSLDLRGTGAAGVALAGFAWLEQLVVEGGTALSVSGQLISEASDFALGLDDGAMAVISGRVTASAGAGVQILGASVGLELMGQIAAETGILVTGRGASLSLAGQVAGSGLGLALTGGDANVTNTGEIRGGVAVSGDAGLPALVVLANSGLIAGGITATLGRAASGFWLTNAGQILGDVSTGGSGDLVTGQGLITGHVALGSGNDRFAGRLSGELDMGQGNDTVDARAGAVRLVRDGGGNDLYLVDGTVVIEDEGGRDTVRSWTDWQLARGLEVLQLQGVADLKGLGNVLGNAISGNQGSNYLSGAGGQDVLSGGEGQDTLRGGVGADLLSGGAGDDRLNGDWGRDTLTGGAGSDVFVFTEGHSGSTDSTADVITDFTPGDRIDLSLIDAVAGNDQANDSFTLVQSLGGIAGQAAVQQLGFDRLIVLDMTGDGQADLAIRLAGSGALGAADFLL